MHAVLVIGIAGLLGVHIWTGGPVDPRKDLKPGEAEKSRTLSPSLPELGMRRVRGVKEKIQFPIYDSFYVPPDRSLGQEIGSGNPKVIRFFVEAQNKTKLETNLKASGVLPALNSFETNALRIVISRDDAVILSQLMYNSVTTLFVGEKVLIEAPTFFFPRGAQVDAAPGQSRSCPMATLRFGEPVIIDPQQHFRVEITFPDEVPQNLGDVVGPLRIWVVLEGSLIGRRR